MLFILERLQNHFRNSHPESPCKNSLNHIQYTKIRIVNNETKTGDNMGIIKASKLVYEYFKYGEDGNVESTQRAIDHVDLDVKKGILLQYWDITVPENLPWQNI